MELNVWEGEYKAVPTNQLLDTTKNGGDEVLNLSSSGATQPVTYSWENITVFYETTPGNCLTRLCKKSPPIRKKILDNVTGIVRPGEFLAIMGASGAGKTTLLNCLTFRNAGQLKISGERYLNGAKVNTDTLARISGYVQQDDLFISTLTVHEHLRFQVISDHEYLKI